MLIEDTLECEKKYIQRNELIFSDLKKFLIIESDIDNHSNYYESLFPLTQQINTISFDQKGEIISTILIDCQFNKGTLEKQLCTLNKLNGYYISCVSIQIIFEQEIEILNEIKETQQQEDFSEIILIPLLTQNDEVCQKLFQKLLDLLVIFCNSLTGINIIEVNTNNLTSIHKVYEFEKTQHEFCQIKYHQVSYDFFMVIYYKCISWAIYIIKNEEINLIFNIDIAKKNQENFDINFVENIQICQSTIILIGDDKYYHYYYTDNGLQFNFLYKYTDLKQILFDKLCISEYLLLYSQLNNTFQITNLYQKYEFQGTYTFVYYFSNLLFLQQEKELQIIFNKNYIERIPIKSYPIYFFELNNIFYYFDQESKAFRFYKCKVFNNFIINPSKKFLLYFGVKEQYQMNFIKCILVQEQNNTSQIQNYNYAFEVRSHCEKIEDQKIQKSNIKMLEDFKILRVKEDFSSFVDSISDQQQFECNIPKKYHQDFKLLYVNQHIISFLVFQTSRYLNVLFCDSQKLDQIFINDFEVINYYHTFLLIKEQIASFRIIKVTTQGNPQLEYKQDSKIIEFLQSSQYVFIQTKSLKRVVIFDQKTQKYVQLPTLLNQILINIYLNNINKQDQKYFYFAKNRYIYFIQYYNHLIVYEKDQFQSFKMKWQIISIKQITSLIDGFKIIAVDQQENSLIQFIFDLTYLKFWQKQIVENGKIIYPFIQIDSNEKLIIEISKNNSTFLYIYQFQDTYPIKLIKTIQTNKMNFFLFYNDLYYFDINNQINILDLNYLNIRFKPFLNYDWNVLINQILIFQIISEFNNQSKIELTLNLSIFLECENLVALQKEVQVILNDDDTIKLNQLFEGAIDNLNIQGNQNIFLEGPFPNSNKINMNNEVLRQNYFIEQFNFDVILFTIQPFPDNQQILKIKIDEKRYEHYQKIQQFLYGSYINKQQIIMVYQENNQTIAQIFRINQENSTLRNDSDCVVINQYPEVIQFTKLRNLLQISQQSSNQFYFIQNSNILKLNNINNIEKLVIIQNSDEQYLEQNYQYFQSSIIIKIFKFNSQELEIIKQINLNSDYLEEVLIKKIHKPSRLYYVQKYFYIVNATLSKQILTFTGLLMFEDYAALYSFQIDYFTDDLKFVLQKIIRNPSNTHYQIKFIDDNYLILNLGLNCYIYDFRVIKNIYYYTFTYDITVNQIQQYNTTHYLFNQLLYNNFILGQIDYRIRFINNLTQRENCTLVAENSVSKAEIILNLDMFQNKSQAILDSSIFIGTICLIVICIILLIYFIRRSFLKVKADQPKKQFLVLSS